MRCSNRLQLGQNEPVVKVVEYADSHLSQRGASCIHASCGSFFYGSFFQQIHHLCAEHLGVLAAHCGGEHTAKVRWSSSELKSITSSYLSHYPR